jgi:hypothetical protein
LPVKINTRDLYHSGIDVTFLVFRHFMNASFWTRG